MYHFKGLWNVNWIYGVIKLNKTELLFAIICEGFPNNAYAIHIKTKQDLWSISTEFKNKRIFKSAFRNKNLYTLMRLHCYENKKIGGSKKTISYSHIYVYITK